MIKPKSYTFFIASSAQGSLRKIRVPLYALHLLLVLAIVGGATVLVAAGAYTRMLWKVGNYNSLRREQDTLKRQYKQLQTTVKDTNQRLSSLQSLATEVAMTYGFMRFRQGPFGLDDLGQVASPVGSEAAYERSVEQFNFLMKNPTAVALQAEGLRLMPRPGLGDAAFEPSLWPVIGHITGSFGERLDPFSGEGAFHTGVDIYSQYGDAVRATANGVVVAVEPHAGYGRVVVIDHGFGISTWYGHLSGFRTTPGARVKRGDVIGYVGVSGRVTGPHVHYEVRIHGAPVNPWRYLRFTQAGD
ncbi:MAG: M23 family metallopeptidase [Acidobacteria bacterium]|nr:M23 family metallopeptidase [Acidobacteriota bacterium]